MNLKKRSSLALALFLYQCSSKKSWVGVTKAFVIFSNKLKAGLSTDDAFIQKLSDRMSNFAQCKSKGVSKIKKLKIENSEKDKKASKNYVSSAEFYEFLSKFLDEKFKTICEHDPNYQVFLNFYKSHELQNILDDGKSNRYRDKAETDLSDAISKLCICLNDAQVCSDNYENEIMKLLCGGDKSMLSGNGHFICYRRHHKNNDFVKSYMVVTPPIIHGRAPYFHFQNFYDYNGMTKQTEGFVVSTQRGIYMIGNVGKRQRTPSENNPNLFTLERSGGLKFIYFHTGQKWEKGYIKGLLLSDELKADGSVATSIYLKKAKDSDFENLSKENRNSVTWHHKRLKVKTGLIKLDKLKQDAPDIYSNYQEEEEESGPKIVVAGCGL